MVISMIYLDYSATTFPRKEVIDTFLLCEQDVYGNANSLHRMGERAKILIDESTETIAQLLQVSAKEIIYTSGASESNNLAIKGLAENNPQKRHIITSMLEHSSVIAPLTYLQSKGYDIDFVELDDQGRYEWKQIEDMIKEDTLCIVLVAVDSETGIRQPVEQIGKLAREHQVPFICDVTQAIGKCAIDLSDMDVISMSAHKIYGLKGIGLCIKRPHIKLMPQIHGGKSVSSLRSGTPPTSLIASYACATKHAIEELAVNEAKVGFLRSQLVNLLNNIDEVTINSNEYSIGHIVNMSVDHIDPEVWVQKFSDAGICLSSKTACSGKENFSKSVYAITKDMQRASTSLRISLSHYTEYEELETFVNVLQRLIKESKA